METKVTNLAKGSDQKLEATNSGKNLPELTRWGEGESTKSIRFNHQRFGVQRLALRTIRQSFDQSTGRDSGLGGLEPR